MPIDPNNLDISTPEKEGDLKKQLIQEYLQSQMQPSEINVISPEEQASRRAGAASNDQIQAGLSQMFNAYSGTDAYKPPPSEMDRTNKEINVELQDALRKRSEERKQQDRQVDLVKYLKGPKEVDPMADLNKKYKESQILVNQNKSSGKGGLTASQQATQNRWEIDQHEKQLATAKKTLAKEGYSSLAGNMTAFANSVPGEDVDGNIDIPGMSKSDRMFSSEFGKALKEGAEGLWEGATTEGKSAFDEAGKRIDSMQNIMAPYSAIENIIINKRSGAAVTTQEMTRLKSEFGNKLGVDPKVTIKAMYRLMNAMKTDLMLASGSPKVREALEKDLGVSNIADMEDAIAKMESKYPTILKDVIGYTPKSTASKEGMVKPPLGVKRQYSPSHNKTKITHPDGRVEILDGRQ